MKINNLLKLLCVLLCLSSPLVQANSKSNSLVLSADGSQFISANMDAGSVSLVATGSGELIKQQALGKDLRRLALDPINNQLLVSDYLANRLYLLDASDLSLIKTIAVGERPFSVLFDAYNKQYYVTLFEQKQLLTLSTAGDITATTTTADTPRGLALTDDGRLLISHSMTGQVSIYNTRNQALDLVKLIQLIDTPAHTDRAKPQGKPRLLDNIAISPDGTQAWLPHVLWSFAEDFQFQSSVFPTISLLDLTPGAEQELTDKRKQLFKQINIIENNNNTRIVSNPHDVAFRDDGKKVFISLSGSEDLLVFDLSRQGKINKKSKRHRRKKRQGGVKATQIYRHIPGANPRSVIALDNTLYVQNAMSHDLVSFDIGGQGPFAKVKLANAQFAKLISQDPVSAELRLGKTLFNLANSDKLASSAMAGDFWMSCNSCHFDGFNFTNKYLMADGTKEVKENALTGHVGLPNMIAGSPIEAYIDMIQKTQGGMGADPKKPELPKIDPKAPPAEVVRLMSSLNLYVTTKENLPYLSTWLRFDDDRKFTHTSDWLNSASCESCHSTIYKQWSDSNHGVHMDSPYYRFQEDVAAKSEGEEFRTLCRGCHAPQTILNNSKAPLSHPNMREKESQSLRDALKEGLPVDESGTSCVFCHRITKAEDAGGNTDLTVNLKDRAQYLFEFSSNPALKLIAEAQINASPTQHKDSYSKPELYKSSLYCATCHNEFTTGQGANVNNNYGEWQASKFNAPDKPEQNKTCIDCHMRLDTSDFNNDVAGQATDDGPIKPNLLAHNFIGGNYYFSDMRSAEHGKLSRDILRNALLLDVVKSTDGQSVEVKVTNHNTGHKMPGGARRQVWIDLVVTDSKGVKQLVSGQLNEGYLPKESRVFVKKGAYKNGESVGLKFWRVEKILKDTRISPDETRVESFALPADISYPIKVVAKINYRSFSKALTNKVKSAFPEQDIPYADVVEINRVDKVFSN
jgi:YVTN family beta-propeller protein